MEADLSAFKSALVAQNHTLKRSLMIRISSVVSGTPTRMKSCIVLDCRLSY